LVKQIKEQNLLHIIDRLSEYASQQKNEELRGIASVGKPFNSARYMSRQLTRCVGLKTVVSEVDSIRGNQVCTRIFPKLLTTMQNVR